MKLICLVLILFSSVFLPGLKAIENSARISAKKQPNVKNDLAYSFDAGSLPPELQDLKSEHKQLYFKARNNDYDFAKFGEECISLTVDELQIFLNIFQEDVEPHGSEIAVKINPAEKGAKLEQVFNQSTVICDFRNLLICHKLQRTCSCPHDSMGANREGICQVAKGHPCEISKQKLKDFGLLVLDGANPVKCLHENTECVYEVKADKQTGASFSPARKICQCRRGYYGATCGRREAPRVIESARRKGDIPASEGKEKETESTGPESDEHGQQGRSLWEHEGGGTLTEYSLHPEEIKQKLEKLLTDQVNQISEEDKDIWATEVVRRLEQDPDKEEMVVHDLYLRELAKLKHGEQCDTKTQIILDNPPIIRGDPGSNQRWADPYPAEIKSWQLGLLNQKKEFCNIYRHFHCDQKTSTCQCQPGLVVDPNNKGLCVIPLGNNCGTEFATSFHFNPLRDKKQFTEMQMPPCIAKTECKYHPLFFEKKCWCEEGQKCEKQFNEDDFSSMEKAIKSRFTLGLNDGCDPALHIKLFSYSTDTNEDPGYHQRIALFREIIANPVARLCDIRNYLNCSAVSRKCECWEQLHPNKGEEGSSDSACIAMNMASCGSSFESGKFMYPKGSQLWELERVFQTTFSPDCNKGSSCAGGNNPIWAGRCVCLKEGKTGDECSEKLSILGSAFKSRQIPKEEDEEISMIRVFFDLNRQTYLLEQLMTLKVDDKCDPKIGLLLDKIVKFWKDIASSNRTLAERRTLPHFTAVTKLTKYLVRTSDGDSSALCNSTLGLRCQLTSMKCECPRGTRWVRDRCYIDADEICDPKPVGDWVPTCINSTRCRIDKTKPGAGHRCLVCSHKSYCDGTDYSEHDDDANQIWRIYDDHKIEGRQIQSDMEYEDEEDDAGKIKAEVEKYKKYFVLHPLGSGVRTTEKPGPPGPPGGDLTDHQKATFLKEIERMIEEILKYRMLPNVSECRYIEEERLSEIFPQLPTYDLNNLLDTIQNVYYSLTRLYWKGISFCNRWKYLSCKEEGICGCSENYDLVDEDGECKLNEHKYCTILDSTTPTSVIQREFPPHFKCRRGTKCTKLDFGLPVCYRSDEDEEIVTGPSGRQSETEDEDQNSLAIKNVGDQMLIIILMISVMLSNYENI